jgi:hypothetical protein
VLVKQTSYKQFAGEGAGYLLSARSGRDPQGDGWSEDGGKVSRDAPGLTSDLAVLQVGHADFITQTYEPGRMVKSGAMRSVVALTLHSQQSRPANGPGFPHVRIIQDKAKDLRLLRLMKRNRLLVQALSKIPRRRAPRGDIVLRIVVVCSHLGP